MTKETASCPPASRDSGEFTAAEVPRAAGNFDKNASPNPAASASGAAMHMHDINPLKKAREMGYLPIEDYALVRPFPDIRIDGKLK
jgi:hypothetical protein